MSSVVSSIDGSAVVVVVEVEAILALAGYTKNKVCLQTAAPPPFLYLPRTLMESYQIWSVMILAAY